MDGIQGRSVFGRGSVGVVWKESEGHGTEDLDEVDERFFLSLRS